MSDFKQKKIELWYRQCKIDDVNLNRIKNLLDFYGLQYELKEIIRNGECCLLIRIGLTTYEIDVCKDNMCLVLQERYSDYNKERFRRLYEIDGQGCFCGSDAWCSVVQYLYNANKPKGSIRNVGISV